MKMTLEQAIDMAKSKLECMEMETSSTCPCDDCDNCSLNYEQGNMGEQKEWLRMAIKALEQSLITIYEIPKDYKYDTETKDFLVYRHKYTGEEIHIERPIPLYRLEQWIPCSERLPNEEEYRKNNGMFNVTDGNRSYSEWFDPYDKKGFGEPTMCGFRVDRCVIAWQPLPEPYKESNL